MRLRSDLAPLFPFAIALAGCGARSSLSVEVDDDGGASEPCRPGSVVVPDGEADRVEIDGSDVYFTVTRNGAGAVLRAPFDEPGTYADVVGGLAAPGDFTIAGGALWVTDEGRIQRVPLDGAPPTTFYEGPETPASEIVADDAGLYWMAPDAGTIWFQGFGATTPTRFVDGIGELRGIALLGPDVVFTARTIPFGNGETNVVASIPKAGGAITVHASDRQEPARVVPVGPRLGWLEINPLNAAPLGLYTMPRDGSAGPTLLIEPPEGMFPLTARAAGDFVVMATYDRVSEGAVVAASAAGGKRRELDRRAELPGELAVARDFVAWTVLPSPADAEAVDLRWVCR